MNDDYMIKQGPELLIGLSEHRDKLISQLARDLGNLEEKMFDPIIARLGAVQGCIAATREAIEDAKRGAATRLFNSNVCGFLRSSLTGS